MAGVANNVFHVEFGINETELTRALERLRWEEAERIIIDNSQSSFLDEGCYRRIPLFIALSGQTDGCYIAVMPRNLYIARLLVQHGANVNYRIPETCFGSEYMNPGHSALELIVLFYNQLTVSHGNRWDPETGPVIGLRGDVILEFEDLLEQLGDLAFIILGHGGDPNIQDEHRMTSLHRILLHSDDSAMLSLLCENGADVNARDIKGNTPLSALCEGNEDGSVHVWAGTQLNIAHLQYMLTVKDVQLDDQNIYGCTALFHCMSRGWISGAALLLEAGSDVTLRGKLYRSVNSRPISALLAAVSYPESHDPDMDIDLANVQRAPVYTHHLAHLIDTGYFSLNQIVAELESYMTGQTMTVNAPTIYHTQTNHSDLASLGIHLIHLMFGGATASLKQLCIRRIFQNCFFRDENPSEISDSPRSWDVPKFSLESSNEDTINKLVYMLNVPKNLLINFHVEMFRQRFCSQLKTCGLELYNNAANGLNDSGSDSDSQSDENDSDLEYW